MKYIYNADYDLKKYTQIEDSLANELKKIMQFFNNNYNSLTKINFGTAIKEFSKAYAEFSRYRKSSNQ